MDEKRTGLIRVHALPALALGFLAFSCASSRPRPAPRPTPRQEALAHTQAERWERAASRWSSIFFAEGGLDIEAGMNASEALMELKRWRSAQEIIAECLRHEPENLELIEREANVLTRLGYRRAAEVRFTTLTKLGVERADLCKQLGVLRMDLGLEAAAVEAFEHSLALNSDDPEVLALLAHAHARSGQPRKAFDVYTQLFDRYEPTADVYYPATGLWRELEFEPDANSIRTECLEWLRSAVDLDPQHMRCHLQLGILYERQGDNERAEQAYRRAIELDPTSLVAVTNLAILYCEADREGEAREMVARAVALEGDRSRRSALRKLLLRFEEAAEPGTPESNESGSTKSNSATQNDKD